MQSSERDEDGPRGQRTVAPTRRTFFKQVGALSLGAMLTPSVARTVAPPRDEPLGRRAPAYVDKWKDACGLHHCSVSDWWAEQCEFLPCFIGVCWSTPAPYAERVYWTNIPGSSDKAVFHLWKGYCNKFASNDDFPGGAGAELGVYRYRTKEWVERNSKKGASRPGTVWGALGGAR